MQNNGHCGVERTNQCQKVNGWYEVSEGGMINIKEVNGNEQV